MTELAWGIAATGGIARTVGEVIAAEPTMRVAAVGSRDQARAADLAAHLGAEHAHGSYAALCEDPSVDAVYIATPHAQHLEVAEHAIANGKAVLCEKSLTASVAEAERMVQLAREHKVFLMEAMWTRFNSQIQHIRKLAQDGRLGDIRLVQASFGFAQPYDPEHRLWNPATGGGALFDLGIYPFALAQLFLGHPEEVHVAGSLAPSGVDAEAGVLMEFQGGARALLDTSLVSPHANSATIVGTLARVDIDAPFWAPTRFTIGDEEFTGPSDGYANEVREVRDALREGRTESAVMPLDDTLAMMRLLEDARNRLL